MMIDSEGYYELNLKDKTQEEILKEIRSLKRKINKLKKCLEDYVSDPVLEQKPSCLTIIKLYREYLERAIQAYEEAGGQYISTIAEKKSQEFDNSLDFIDKMVFEIGGFFTGFERRIYTIDDDQVNLHIENVLNFEIKDVPLAFKKDEFIHGLQRIHIGEWKRNYDNLDILDGTSWSLELYFSNDKKAVKIYGSNAYPYNFSDLTDFLGIDEEEMDYE